jgi:hypothetical protein
MPQMYQADVIPGEGITGYDNSFRVFEDNVSASWEPPVCFAPAADILLPPVRPTYDSI